MTDKSIGILFLSMILESLPLKNMEKFYKPFSPCITPNINKNLNSIVKN
jgi:hypothetical protein